MQSLLAHVALRLATHPENLATESLGYLLTVSPAARLGILRALPDAARMQLPEQLRYVTQVFSEDDGRPDLVGLDELAQKRVLIEVKFWAGFTAKQPLGYLAQLPPGGLLLVIGPRARQAYMVRELGERLQQKNQSVEKRESLGDDLIHLVANERHVVITSWQRVLQAIDLELMSDPARRADVAQLLGLCERMDTEAFIPVTEEELSSNVYRRVHEFGTIVDQVVADLVKSGVLQGKKSRATGSNGWYGRYVWLSGVGVSLHVSTHKWTKFGGTPVWLTVYGMKWHHGEPSIPRQALAPWEAVHAGRLFEDSLGFPTIAIRIPAGAEQPEIRAAIATQIADVGLALTQTALARNNSNAASPGDDVPPDGSPE